MAYIPRTHTYARTRVTFAGTRAYARMLESWAAYAAPLARRERMRRIEMNRSFRIMGWPVPYPGMEG